MDIATIIGIVSGFGLISVTILMGGNAGIFLNVPSILVVLGGTVAATLINFPMGDVVSVFGTIRNAFFVPKASPPALIERIVEFATVARREGILSLESQTNEEDDEFLQRAVQLAIDG